VSDYGILLGGARIYQKRVKSASCTVNGVAYSETCYPSFSDDDEDTSTRTSQTVTEAQTWHSAEDLGFNIFSGQKPTFDVTKSWERYEMGSYVVTLPLNQTDASEIVTKLETDNFIDKQTRLVVIDFTLYNAAYHMHTNVQFGFEFRQAGGITVQSRILSFKMFRYDWGDMQDNITWTIEIVLYSYVLMFISVQLFDIFKWGLIGWLVKNGVIPETVKHAEDGPEGASEESNQAAFEILDNVNLILLVITFIYRIMVILSSFVQEYDLNTAIVTYQNHAPIAAFFGEVVNIWGINSLIAIFKLFKYLQIDSNLNSLWRTLMFAWTDLVNYIVFFTVVILNFTLTGMVWFGHASLSWYNVSSAFTTLFLTMLGQNSYAELHVIQSNCAFLFFFLYIILVYLILLNMFLAIINNAYSHIMGENMKKEVIQNLIKGDNATPAFWTWVTKTVQVAWASLLVCDFKNQQQDNLKDMMEDMDDDAMDDDDVDQQEDDLIEELREKFDEDETGFMALDEPTTKEWFDLADTEQLKADKTSNFVSPEGEDVKELLSELTMKDQNENGDREQVRGELTEEERELEMGKNEKIKNDLKRAALKEEYGLLQEQCKLYMDVDSQLTPSWLAQRFQKVEADAKQYGFKDIENDSREQARLIMMTANRSATTSRLFSLLNPNESMPTNASHNY